MSRPAEGFFRHELVRFHHCDPAGIVFYPRYVEMINATIEDWFAEVVGISFAEIHGPLHFAVPIASLDVQFRSPSRLGEVLRLGVRLERLGSSSVTLHVTAANEGREVFAARVTLVLISKDDYRPKPWPQPFREAMSDAH
ncbi:MAG: thioesterase [Cereibacter sphaeroides]|uniref:Thioesterase n=1 Tax=Cereibacter sphaeroides TaxID=1063 RepID=A0A2W5U7A7_CERSP|nr:MAG: thioesterase [Cereibacter sphaeroides]